MWQMWQMGKCTREKAESQEKNVTFFTFVTFVTFVTFTLEKRSHLSHLSHLHFKTAIERVKKSVTNGEMHSRKGRVTRKKCHICHICHIGSPLFIFSIFIFPIFIFSIPGSFVSPKKGEFHWFCAVQNKTPCLFDSYNKRWLVPFCSESLLLDTWYGLPIQLSYTH